MKPVHKASYGVLSILVLSLVTVLSVGCRTTAPQVGDLEAEVPSTYMAVKSVVYQENHDPSVVYLKDGSQLWVHYSPDRSWEFLTWDEVEEWEAGHPLLFAYSTINGVVLVDDESGKELPVVGGFGENHPFDIQLKRELDRDGSTAGIQSAYNDVWELWQLELDRLVHRLDRLADQLEPNHPALPLVKDLQKAQQAWQAFREAHADAAARIYNAQYGTMSIITHASASCDFLRHRALELGLQVSDLDEMLERSMEEDAVE